MASGVDGSIRIDTKIDSTGFNSGVSTLSKGFAGITKAAGVVGIALTAAFAVKQLIVFGKQAVELASDMQEVQNVVDTAFGSMAYKMEEFAETAIETYGISKLTAKQTGSTFMAMARGMGLALDKSSDMAIQLTALSADVSSFYNVSQDVASTALKSIFTGETETLKQFGIVMTQANLQQFAYDRGIKTSISSMSQAQQVQLRYLYVMKQTSLAQGDFAKTSSSWANQTRMLSENWKELLSILGSGLIQVLIPVVQILNELLKGLIKIAKAIGYVINLITGADDIASDITGSTDDLGTSAGNAADSENDLASGIGSAAKAAQNALAKFDQLDVLQQNMGSGGGGGFDSGDFDIGDLGLKDTGKSLDDAKKKVDNFLVGLKEKLHEFATEPVLVFDPVFLPIPDPVYVPNWGLASSLASELALVYSYMEAFEPSFQHYTEGVVSAAQGVVYGFSEAIQESLNSLGEYETDFGISSEGAAEIFQGAAQGILLGLAALATGILTTSQSMDGFETNMGLSSENMAETFALAMDDIISGLRTAMSASDEFSVNFGVTSDDVQTTIGETVQSFKEGFSNAFGEASAFEANFGVSSDSVISAMKGQEDAISLGTENMKTNFNSLKETAINNIAEMVVSNYANFQNWKAWVTDAVYQTGTYLISNFNIALETTSKSVVDWANNTSENLATWGQGVLKISWDVAKGIALNIISGLKTAWENFKEFVTTTGETISNAWNENQSWIKPTLTITALAAAGVALVLSGGSLAAPLAAGAALVPALATGAVIPPNQQFMAILGDQKSGRNLEAPEGLIRQIMQEELAGLSDGGNMTIEMPVILDGELIYKNQKKVARRHGTRLVTGGI